MVLSSLSCPLTVQGTRLGSPVALEVPLTSPLNLRYRCGESQGVIARALPGGKFTWVPPVALAAEYPALQHIPVELTLELLRGERVAESRREWLLLELPQEILPQGQLTVTDESGAAEKCGSFVQGISRAAVQVEAQGSAGAEIRECRISCGPLTGTGTRVRFDIPKSGPQTVTAVLTDSRGRTRSLTTAIRVLERIRPQGAIVSARPCDEAGNLSADGDHLLVEAVGSVTPLPNLTAAFVLAGTDGAGAEKSWSLGAGPKLEAARVIPELENLELRVSDGLETLAFPYRPRPLIDLDVPGHALGIGRRGAQANAVSVGLPVDMGENALTGLPLAQAPTAALPLGQAEERFLSPRLLWENPTPEAAFPAGEIPAAGWLFLIEGTVKPGGTHFWEIVGTEGCLRGPDGEKTAVRPVQKTAGALVFGSAEPGDDRAIPLRVFRLLPGKEAQ